MDNYNIWEKKVEENHKRNENFIKEFESWLIQKTSQRKLLENI